MAKEEKQINNKPLIIIVGAILVAVGVFAGAYFGMNKSNVANADVIEESYFELGEIFVNLTGDNAKKYVKLTASVTYDIKNKDLATELEKKKVSIRDAAIYYFKSCTADDFKPEKESTLKGNLVKELNTKLTTGVLLDVKFNELLIQ